MREITVLHYAEITTPNWLLFEAAAKRRDIELVSWEPHRLQIYCASNECRPYYDGQALIPDIVLHRTVALFEGIVVPALTLWSALGSCVLNPPAAAYLSRDKLATTVALCAHDVPFVATLGLDGSNDQPLFGLGAGRVVIKPAHGLRGQGVRDFASMDSVTRPVGGAGAPRPGNQHITNAYCVREHV
ncbi:MAG: hypothetical protein L0Y54_22060, partial [Sporichthyaceae bacterium]|nr:hypothetical protein [Sporichthyaceae bacterium]